MKALDRYEKVTGSKINLDKSSGYIILTLLFMSKEILSWLIFLYYCSDVARPVSTEYTCTRQPRDYTHNFYARKFSNKRYNSLGLKRVLLKKERQHNSILVLATAKI